MPTELFINVSYRSFTNETASREVQSPVGRIRCCTVSITPLMTESCFMSRKFEGLRQTGQTDDDEIDSIALTMQVLQNLWLQPVRQDASVMMSRQIGQDKYDFKASETRSSFASLSTLALPWSLHFLDGTEQAVGSRGRERFCLQHL